jgi:hypothetical protein
MFDSLQSVWKLKRVILDHDPDATDDDDDDTIIPPVYKHIGCHVDFEVTMTVSDPLTVVILDKILLQVAGHQVDAFDRRCKELPLPIDLIKQVEGEEQ